MTIESRLAEIRARAENATEGPWEHQPRGGQNQNGDHSGGEVFDAHGEYLIYDVSDEDGAFIAHSRTDLPALLAAVEAFKEKCDYIVNEFEDPVYESNGYALGVVAATRTLMDTITTALEVEG